MSEFHVFLAHNSLDKPLVREIAKELKRRDLKPWLDEEQIPPGRSFQDEIQQAIPVVESAAVFIGCQGLGRWQSWELKVFISQCVENKIPVIPVLLPGVSELPHDLYLLKQLNWVSFIKEINDENALDQLEWGITGKKPEKILQSDQKPGKIPTEQLIINYDNALDRLEWSITGKKPEKILQSDQKPGKIPTEQLIQTISSSVNQVFQFSTVKLYIEDNRIKSVNPSSQTKYFIEDLGCDVILEMVEIPGGRFTMGASANEEGSADNERPIHQVTVEPFFMGKYLITQEQWERVANSFRRINRNLEPQPSEFKGNTSLPVEQVCWFDAVEFCARLAKETSRNYRLPSEAEWEYACRADTTTPFNFGETITTDVANYIGNITYGNAPEGVYRKKTTLVKSFLPNTFGLCDMHGNLQEWCADYWHENYEGAPTDGSAWLHDNNNQFRLLRGGSWSNPPEKCRSAYRTYYYPDNRDNEYGFRVVCDSAF